MKDRVIERLKLMHELWERNLSNTTIEAIVQLLENTRLNKGHSKAEEIAKELLTLIESGISEAELLNKLNQMK